MTDKAQPSVQASPEQLLYAKILEIGMYIGLALLFITFLLYVLGLMKPYIPMDQLTSSWSLPVHEYLEKTNVQPGWSWLGRLGSGDFINFIGIALLAGVTIVCYLAIVPVLFRNKDKAYAVLALAEVVILALAASGLLAAGH